MYNRENIQQKKNDSMRKLFKHTLFQSDEKEL